MNLEKEELLDNCMIQPECISINNHTELNSDWGSTIKRIKKESPYIKIKIKELIDFIQENHLYYGISCLRSYIKTIIPEVGYDPIFSPKNFKVILTGLDLGLKYIIRTDANGACPFLKLNKCLIHKIKPLDCKNFPYNKDGSLRRDSPFISICSGLQKK
ncbi:MAG: YkgJ family cysteine cluster protein [Promethearchaeota archaeon]|nr:MAG: YkgJ family cysteine cluster protein [Candidatus Lokiarchaeota archaeon]